MPLRYQEVKAEIMRMISGLKSGSRIPSRNFLSRKLEAARNTVDKAIAELEAEGWLTSVKGSGTYVSGRRLEKMQNIGIILPSIMGDIYPPFILGIEQYAAQHNINVVLLSSENMPERQQRNVQQALDMQADGCIIIPVINSELSFQTFMRLKKRGIPFVICNRYIDGLDVPYVGSNNHYGAYMAAKHLIGQGCSRLAYFSQRKYSSAIERYHGFETALLESGCDVEKNAVILGNYEEETLKQKLREIYGKERYPDGALCFDDTMATVLYAILQEKGLQPGKDVKIVGYDNSRVCNILSVPLSSVSARAKEMGKEAVALLMGMIGGTGDGTDFKLVNPRLIIRKSSCEEQP